MTVARLISILNTMPPDAEIRISYWEHDFDNATERAVNSLCFKEAWKTKNDVEWREPNRIILS